MPRQSDTMAKLGLYWWDYRSMLDHQGGVCAICKSPPSPTRNLAVDHDHATGKSRGLLCHRCNMGLGYYRDNPEFLRAAAAYLESPRERDVHDCEKFCLGEKRGPYRSHTLQQVDEEMDYWKATVGFWFLDVGND